MQSLIQYPVKYYQYVPGCSPELFEESMGSQWGYDRTHLRAKHEGYRSRAAYKLLEIQHKFAIIRPDDNIVNLGAAPGSWLQIERTLTSARVVGIDLNT